MQSPDYGHGPQNPSPSKGATLTPRTFEDIERDAADILEQERQALQVLTHCIREIAVRLPPASRLTLDLADAAKSLQVFAVCDDPQPGLAVRCAFGVSGLSRAIELYMTPVDDED